MFTSRACAVKVIHRTIVAGRQGFCTTSAGIAKTATKRAQREKVGHVPLVQSIMEDNLLLTPRRLSAMQS
jgi:hypothetical protein